MKKVKVLSLLFLIVSIAAFMAYQVYSKGLQDNVPPVVECDQDVIEVSVQAEDAELIQGVTAKDNRSGDVTDTIVIEKMSAMVDNERIVTYAAVDKHMNVGRITRTVKYTDYEAPEFSMDAPLCFPVGTSDIRLLQNISASSKLDGDLTKNIKYALADPMDIQEAGDYPIQYRVTDSAGNVEYLDTSVLFYDRIYSAYEVKLSEYLVYVKKGKSFDPNSYYVGVDGGAELGLDVQSHVDTSKEGTYYVDYVVSDGNRGGISRLVVVVR